MRWLVVLGVVALSLFLTGCADSLTGRVVDEQGCSKPQTWCGSLGECIDSWEQYCPKEGESVKLLTANGCEFMGGHFVNYGGGERCADDEKVVGEVAGFLSLYVCCMPPEPRDYTLE